MVAPRSVVEPIDPTIGFADAAARFPRRPLMFNRFALAVLAASLVAGPVLAQNASPSTAPADKSTSASDTSKPVKHARHAKVAKTDKVAQTDEQNVKPVKPVKHAHHIKHSNTSSTTGAASPDQDKASKPAKPAGAN
jgi:hypothetical protein